MRELLAGLFRRGKEDQTRTIWALRDLSFEVAPGQVLGIIGRNGSGKSTLLKLLSKVTPPTKGRITTRGRIGSLIEIGTGFHPELTGKENIFLYSSILGMRYREIKARYDEIVEFSGVEQMLNTPLKRYSSGMIVRLAFSVASHVHAEILLLDEILAVGDLVFQRKCFDRVSHLIQKEGTVVLFVSHAMQHIERLCERVLLLNAGELIADGPTSEVLKEYQALAQPDVFGVLPPLEERAGNGRMRLNRVFIARNPDSPPQETLATGEPAILRMEYSNFHDSQETAVSLTVRTEDGRAVFSTNKCFMASREKGDGTITCIIDPLPLLPRSYRLNIEFHDQAGGLADRVELPGLVVEKGVAFVEEACRATDGLIAVNAEWG